MEFDIWRRLSSDPHHFDPEGQSLYSVTWIQVSVNRSVLNCLLDISDKCLGVRTYFNSRHFVLSRSVFSYTTLICFIGLLSVLGQSVRFLWSQPGKYKTKLNSLCDLTWLTVWSGWVYAIDETEYVGAYLMFIEVNSIMIVRSTD